MRVFLTIAMMSLGLAPLAQAQDLDFLGNQSISYTADDADQVFLKSTTDLKSLFQRFQPALDSDSKITSPIVVDGPSDHPRVRGSIQKCILFICKTVDLVAQVEINGTNGACQRNMVLVADLKNSSSLLSDTYDALQVSICFNRVGTNGGKVDVSASAHHAANYELGTIQNENYKFLKNQVAPMVKALQETAKANGAH